MSLCKTDSIFLTFIQRTDDLGLSLSSCRGELLYNRHVKYDGVGTIAEQLKEHAVIIGELFQFLGLSEILHKRNGRSTCFDSNNLSGQIFQLADGLFILTNKDHQTRNVVALREIDDLGPFRRNGHTGNPHVNIARLKSRDNAIEIHGLELVGDTYALGDFLPQLNIKSSKLSIRPLEFKRHEIGVVRNNQFLGRNRRNEQKCHQKPAKQRGKTFHENLSRVCETCCFPYRDQTSPTGEPIPHHRNYEKMGQAHAPETELPMFPQKSRQVIKIAPFSEKNTPQKNFFCC